MTSSTSPASTRASSPWSPSRSRSADSCARPSKRSVQSRPPRASPWTPSFSRVPWAHKDRRGLGIGLHVAKGIVDAHGGRMWVESKLAAGSTFHFALPVASGRT
ncbi:MAG TPA: ATP-binding protein [Polyangia bacterium]